MSTTASNACSACGGRGWLLMFNTDTAALEIQRCDSCCCFDADEEAQRVIATDESALVVVLFEFCSALKAEAERIVHETTNVQEDGKQALRTIRDSLRNVCDLRMMEGGARSASAIHHSEEKTCASYPRENAP
ncbi:MAG: hypothetical protein IT365_04555 [Candidatus Hydrogenedentes bacterium]|nr:hypothetical protein [Candidatus Hydrogenedentota bacterium]